MNQKQENSDHSIPSESASLPDVAEHFCVPCDVETMARRVNLDKRRLQQITKDDPSCKNEQKEYICPRVMLKYILMLQNPKRSKASGLVKKQEESLEIRNARDRAEVLAEWRTMVQRKSVIAELAPAFVALKNGIRKIPSAHCNDIVMFAKKYAQTVQDGNPTPDHELVAQVLKMLGGPIDDSLRSCVDGLRQWLKKPEEPKEPKNGE